MASEGLTTLLADYVRTLTRQGVPDDATFSQLLDILATRYRFVEDAWQRTITRVFEQDRLLAAMEGRLTVARIVADSLGVTTDHADADVHTAAPRHEEVTPALSAIGCAPAASSEGHV